MEKNLAIVVAIGIFLVSNYVFYKTQSSDYKNEAGKRLWKLGGVRVYFWQASVYLSTGITALALFLLKWSNVIAF